MEAPSYLFSIFFRIDTLSYAVISLIPPLILDAAMCRNKSGPG